jgi:hypothetical protein
LIDYCPRCKRVMRGLAYAGLPDTKEKVFVGSRAEEELAADEPRMTRI